MTLSVFNNSSECRIGKHKIRSNNKRECVIPGYVVAVEQQEARDSSKLTLIWLDSCNAGSPEGINWIRSSIISLFNDQSCLVS